MKTNVILVAVLLVGCFLLFGFGHGDRPQTGKTEEYGEIVYNAGIAERTINGKTEVIKLEGEKLEGGLMRVSYNTALVNELNKMNAEGFEIVNVSVALGTSYSKDIYLFRRRK